MKKETYKELQKSMKKDALIFIEKLLQGDIPLSHININDWKNSIPAVYIDTPYPNRKQKRYIRFSDFDSSNAVNFYLESIRKGLTMLKIRLVKDKTKLLLTINSNDLIKTLKHYNNYILTDMVKLRKEK